MTVPRTNRRPISIALATFLVGACLAVLVGGLTHPAAAREFKALTVTKEAPSFAKFPGIPESLAYLRKPDPDFCRDAQYCDTIPVRIPIPDIPAGAGYELTFKADNTDGADLDVFLWDNKQLKEKYGKCQPGDACYDPLETDYTNILAITDPQHGGAKSDGIYKVGRPDLVDYNITVLNFGGTSTGYTIYMELKVEDYVPPTEVKPPDHNTVATPSGGTSSGFDPTPSGPTVTEPAPGAPVDLPSLNDLLIQRDPDLQAIHEQDLANELAAPPTPISQLRRADTGPPPPASGLMLFLWFAVVPAALAGGAATLVQRRRVLIPDLG